MRKVSVIYCVLLSSFVVTADKPGNFKICKRSDPKLNECLTQAIQEGLHNLKNGISSFGIGPLDPIELVSATVGEGKGAVNVVQKYTDMKVYNLGTSKVSDVKATITPTHVIVDWITFISNLTLDGNYDFNGRLLLVPLVGIGHCTLTLKDMNATVRISGDVEVHKGKKYLKLSKFELKLDPKLMIYNFENLFNGDENLGKTTNQLMNDNWKEVFDDVKPGYEEVFQLLFINYANQLFSKIPFDELFPE